MSTILYSSELWPLSLTQMKKLKAAHHKFQRRLLGISWKDKVKNDDIGKKTGLQKLEDIIKERRLRWLGHFLRMEYSRTPQQAMHAVGTERIQEEAGTAKGELDGHHEAQPEEHGHQLGGGRRAGGGQDGVASTCGPMHL